MKLMTQDRPRLPVEDYSVALRNAVSWLGKRYLLAEPVKAHSIAQKLPIYFAEQEHWHDRVAESD